MKLVDFKTMTNSPQRSGVGFRSPGPQGLVKTVSERNGACWVALYTRIIKGEEDETRQKGRTQGGQSGGRGLHRGEREIAGIGVHRAWKD